MSRKASPSAFLPKIEVSSARSRESFDTSCSTEATRSCHTGGPFLFLTGAAGGSLGRTKGKRFSVTPAQVVCHPHLQACLVHQLDMLVFPLTKQRLHVSTVDQVAHATWSLADSQDSSCPTQYVPSWSAQLERNTDQKLDM